MSIFRLLVSMVAAATEKKWRTQIAADVAIEVIKDVWVTCNKCLSLLQLVKAMSLYLLLCAKRI